MERNVYIGVVVRPPTDAQDMILVTDTPDRVRVRLKGSRARLNAIRQENLPPVDVKLKTKDEPRYYFEKEIFDLPTGVSVVPSLFVPSSGCCGGSDAARRSGVAVVRGIEQVGFWCAFPLVDGGRGVTVQAE